MNKTEIQELIKDLDPTEVLRKANNDEQLTVEEVILYERLVKPNVHFYGKYVNNI